MPGLIETREPELTQDEVEDVRRLEELWAASADEAPPIAPARMTAIPVALRFGPLLALACLGFLASIFFEPASEPGTATPLWGEYLILTFWVALVAAAIMGIARAGRGAYACATFAGALGIGLAVACRTTSHHLGSWWLYELGATAALTALGAAGLIRSRRRS